MSKVGGKAAPFALWERAVAGRYLRARKKDAGVALISILAFLGVTAAVFALIVIMSVMNGFRTELLNQILGFNPHIEVSGQAATTEPTMDLVIRKLKAVPGVTDAVPVIERQAMIASNAQMGGVFVRGMRPADLKNLKLISSHIKQGSLDGFGQGEYGGDLLILGDRLASDLGVSPGDSVSLIAPGGTSNAFGIATTQKDYIVGGIFSVGNSEYDSGVAYMAFQQAQLFFGMDGQASKIALKVTDPDTSLDLKPALFKAVGPGTYITDWTEKSQAFFNALQIERNVMRLILMFIVVIAAINIVSGLIMLVKNKGRDIAILRTMGASRSGILRIFFMSGASIGVAGTLTGLILGVLFCLNISKIQEFIQWVTGADLFNADVYFLTHIPARIEPHEVALIVGWSLIVSFIATLPPALRAARLDPVEALRYE